VPEVYALCMDKDVVGAGFYVMEFLEGRVFQNIFMKEVNDEDRRAWCVHSSSSSSSSFSSSLPYRCRSDRMDSCTR
jgi:hypothetical protein